MSTIHQIISRQVAKYNLEKALEYQRRFEGAARATSPAVKPIITVSRQRGARGCELAKTLAEDLHYTFIDRLIVDSIANDIGIRRDWVEMLDEHDRSELEIWVRTLLSDRVFDYDEYIHELSKILKTIAMQGGAVILGRGANFILTCSPALNVRAVAPVETRIRNIMESEGKTEKQARQEIATADKERAHLVWRYFNHDIEDPLAYDVVLNMASITITGAVKIVRDALIQKFGSTDTVDPRYTRTAC